MGVGGYFYIDYRQAESRHLAYRELSAIADLKLNQITEWRRERLADAHFFSRALFAAQDLRHFLDSPDSEPARDSVLNWLGLLKGGDRYNRVIVYDAALKARLSLPPTATVSPAYLQPLAERVRATREVLLTDLEHDPASEQIHLDVLFPIFENADPVKGVQIATVLLRLDARQYLFPLVQSWPTPSQTAETLLVRQDADDVLFLNDLRYRPGAALHLRLPLSLTRLPAARALRGEVEINEGLDYRRVPVVATGRRIPGSAWAMVAKIDRDEVYAPLRHQLFIGIIGLSALLLACVLLVGLLWRQRELALEKQRNALSERLALLMRYANDIIFLFDPSGQVLEANEAASRSYGYTQAELQRLTLRDLRVPEALPNLERDLKRINSEGTLCFETRHRRKNGECFHVEVSSRKIRIRDETLILSILRDITQRKQAEAELRQAKDDLVRANTELEKIVQERTAQLRETVSELQAFSYSLSHDMRAPLRAIQSFSGLLQDVYGSQLGPEGKQYLDPILSSAQRMTRMVDDVLAFSRASRQELACQAVDFEKLVRDLIAERPEFQKPQAFIDLAGPLPAVQGDEASLTQCVTNLLGNAVKYVAPGVTPRVLVRAETVPNGVRVWFEDNGIGIDEKAHDKVFNLFHRHCPPGAQYEGSGIGLAIVKKAVERMGGKVGVVSVTGKGSRFWVELGAPADTTRD